MKNVKNTEPKVNTISGKVKQYNRVEDTRYFTEKQVNFTYKQEVTPADTIFRKTLKNILHI